MRVLVLESGMIRGGFECEILETKIPGVLQSLVMSGSDLETGGLRGGL